MKIRPAVPENGCLIFLVDGKKTNKTKKTKKTSVKHIRYRLIGGCVNDIAQRHTKFLMRSSVVLILNKQKSFNIAFENISRESRISKVVQWSIPNSGTRDRERTERTTMKPKLEKRPPENFF